MLTGVLQEVQEGFTQPILITANPGRTFQYQFLIWPDGLQALPLLLDDGLYIGSPEMECVTVCTEPLQPKQCPDQIFHALDLVKALGCMGRIVQFRIEPQGGQGRLQLMGDVCRQLAGSVALLGVQLLRPGQSLLGVCDAIMKLGKGIFFQSHIQHFPCAGIEVIHQLRQFSDPAIQDEIANQQTCADDGKDDQSTHWYPTPRMVLI